MLSSVEFCPVCMSVQEMSVVPTKLKLYSQRPEGMSYGKYNKTKKQIGVVKAWIVCSKCNTIVRDESEEWS